MGLCYQLHFPQNEPEWHLKASSDNFTINDVSTMLLHVVISFVVHAKCVNV